MARTGLLRSMFCLLVTAVSVSQGAGFALPPDSVVVSRALDEVQRGQAEARARISGNAPLELAPVVMPVRGDNAVPGLFFEMGYENYDYKYDEYVNDKEDFMALRGRFRGLYGSLIWQPVKGSFFYTDVLNYFGFDFRAAWASLSYTGGVQDDEGNVVAALEMNSIPDVVVETRVTAGHYMDWDGFRITPYAGLAYRFLKDDSSDVVATFNYLGTDYLISGYKRNSQYVYLPIGVTVEQTVYAGWNLGLNLEGDILLAGMQESYVETAIGSSVQNRQTNGIGARAGLKLGKNFKTTTLNVEPFVRYWKIRASDFAPIEQCTSGSPCLGAIEPYNTTREVGLKAGVAF